MISVFILDIYVLKMCMIIYAEWLGAFVGAMYYTVKAISSTHSIPHISHFIYITICV